MAKRQMEVPGTERKHIKEVVDAASGYEDARDKRMKLTEKEASAKESLIEVMKKHKLTVYRDDEAVPPILVTLKPGKDAIKVERLEVGDGADE